MRPDHPREILLKDYIKPKRIGARALSLALHVPYSRLRESVDGNKRGGSADMAPRLERYFGSLRWWLPGTGSPPFRVEAHNNRLHTRRAQAARCLLLPLSSR